MPIQVNEPDSNRNIKRVTCGPIDTIIPKSAVKHIGCAIIIVLMDAIHICLEDGSTQSQIGIGCGIESQMKQFVVLTKGLRFRRLYLSNTRFEYGTADNPRFIAAGDLYEERPESE